MTGLSPRARRIAAAVAVAVLLGAPFVAYPLFLVEILTFALLAASVNLLISYVGLLSFGHAMFFGSSAYVTGYAIKTLGLEPVSGILLGTAVAAGIGWVTGQLAIRRLGIYFSMVTLAFGQLAYFLALRASFTGGEDGLQDVPRRAVLGLIDLRSNVTVYYFTLAVVGAGFFVIYRLVHSPFGQVLQAIRDHEPRATSLGYRTRRCKLLVFVISAALAGMAGGVKVVGYQLATLNDITWVTSGEALLICILGGIYTLVGPAVGAMVIVSMSHYLASFAEWVLIIQGFVFVVVVMLLRRGIVGELYAWLERREEARQPAATVSPAASPERAARRPHPAEPVNQELQP
jgi:branched-chain amino acid transport system permease protein